MAADVQRTRAKVERVLMFITNALFGWGMTGNVQVMGRPTGNAPRFNRLVAAMTSKPLESIEPITNATLFIDEFIAHDDHQFSVSYCSSLLPGRGS